MIATLLCFPYLCSFALFDRLDLLTQHVDPFSLVLLEA
jgi:hypothetical protein